MKKPLSQKKILVTRAQTQSGDFAKELKKFGATVYECPLIKIEPPKSWQSLDRALAKLDQFDWIIFTSANGVKYFLQRFKKNGRKNILAKICAIGPVTAQTLKKNGFLVTKQAKNFVSESILDSLKNVTGKNILIVRAKIARQILPQTLKQRGARVQIATAYQTLQNVKVKHQLKKFLEQSDCVTFTSASTVKSFFALAPKRARKKICAASIGPITTQTLKDFGVEPKIQAKESTILNLTQSVAKYFKETHYEK